MPDDVKMTTVPLADLIRLEQQRDAYHEALRQIMAMGHRLDCLSRSPLGSGCTCPAGIAEMALTAPHQGAMSDG